MVIIPSSVTSIYIFFFASNQYHSIAAFAIRSGSSAPASDFMGFLMSPGADSTESNSYIVSDYVQSQTLLEDIASEVDLTDIYNRSGADWLFRMGEDLPIEERLSYWNSMIDVDYDSTSGVIYLEVRSFDPRDSLRISSLVMEKSEKLVNELSAKNRRESVRYAEEAVAKSETRLKAIRKQILQYRKETQEVSPEDDAKIALQLIGQLDNRISEKKAERLKFLSYLDTESPRIRLLSEEIAALENQLQLEKSRVGGGSTGSMGASISERLASFSELALEEEFAQDLFTTALAGLEQARQEANRNSLYLATFIPPTLSDRAQYPNRLLYSLSTFLILLGAWLLCVLMYYNIRDRN